MSRFGFSLDLLFSNVDRPVTSYPVTLYMDPATGTPSGRYNNVCDCCFVQLCNLIIKLNIVLFMLDIVRGL